jgi:hypothetical protein
MEYLQLFADQFAKIKVDPNATRSSALLVPMHSAIADQVEKHGFKTKSLRNKEYNFVGPYGEKQLDVAIFDNNKLIGAIMFKGIRSEYNKNRNNYFENMRGESQLLIDGNIPVYQIILIPMKCKHKNSAGKIVFETPEQKSTENYNSYILSGCKPEKLKLGVFYIDLNYKNFTASYATRRVEAIPETTMTEGINNFCMSLR